MASYEEDEEDTFYGTPVTPLEDHENAPKKADLDLTVRDEKGRRRFHGAFTGGFSAGYFNTVGSVEGWVPSQFVSKKDDKWEKELLKNKPEDYMDDEDFSVFGIAPKKVQTKEKFQESQSFAGLRDSSASVGDVLRDVIQPVKESVGIKLFKLMKRGIKYKNAQVIGESDAQKKVYGCLPPGMSNAQKWEDDENYDDYVLPYAPKSDNHGLGFSRIMAEQQKPGSSKTAPLNAMISGKRLKISGEAFGYGALENEEEYDEDAQVYGSDDFTQYDFAIGSTARSGTSRNSKTTNKISDIIEGFLKAKISSFVDSEKHILPHIPKHWRPKPPFKTAVKRQSRWDLKNPKEPKVDPVPVKQTDPTNKVEPKKTNTLNANARAILLGEEVSRVIGIKKKSFVTPEKSGQKTEINDPKPAEKEYTVDMIEKERPLKGFFSDKFTRSSMESSTELTPGLTSIKDIKIDEKFKDQVREKEPTVEIGTKKRASYQWHPHGLLSKRFNVPPPYPQYPDVVGLLLVGKRDESKSIASTSKTNNFHDVKPKPNVFAHLEEIGTNEPKEPQTSSENKIWGIDKSQDIESDPESDMNSESNSEEVGNEKPPIDLFKSIFASDEDESDDDGEDEEKEKTDENPISQNKGLESKSEKSDEPEFLSRVKIEIAEPEISKSRDNFPSNSNKVASSGVFANINFDNLNQFCSRVDAAEELKIKIKEEDLDYGPSLPPEEVAIKSDDHSTDYNRKRKSSETKKKKKKSKKKHDKKYKKKYKKHKKEKSSSSSSSDSGDEFRTDFQLYTLIKNAKTS